MVRSIDELYDLRLANNVANSLAVELEIVYNKEMYCSEPALEPPAPPGRGGPHDPQGPHPHVTAGQFFYRPYSITSHTCTILFSARCNQSLA